MATIGERIIAARKAKGMTQEALSKAVSVSRSTVAHWETGRTMPGVDMWMYTWKQIERQLPNKHIRRRNP